MACCVDSPSDLKCGDVASFPTTAALSRVEGVGFDRQGGVGNGAGGGVSSGTIGGFGEGGGDGEGEGSGVRGSNSQVS